MSAITVEVNIPADEFIFLPVAIPSAKIALGRIVMTANAYRQLPAVAVVKALHRHAAGDWGEVCDDDRKENELSLKEGFRLLSVYGAGEGRFWIITEADRSVTTVLLPQDY